MDAPSTNVIQNKYINASNTEIKFDIFGSVDVEKNHFGRLQCRSPYKKLFLVDAECCKTGKALKKVQKPCFHDTYNSNDDRMNILS